MMNLVVLILFTWLSTTEVSSSLVSSQLSDILGQSLLGASGSNQSTVEDIQATDMATTLANVVVVGGSYVGTVSMLAM
jgi:hypothetical protein